MKLLTVSLEGNSVDFRWNQEVPVNHKPAENCSTGILLSDVEELPLKDFRFAGESRLQVGF